MLVVLLTPILMPEFFVNDIVFVVLLAPILMPEFFVKGVVFVVLLTPILMPVFRQRRRVCGVVWHQS